MQCKKGWKIRLKRCSRRVAANQWKCRIGTQSMFQMQLKHSKILRAIERNDPRDCSLERLSSTRHWVKDHMNAKMILAALALSLSIAACAKKDEAPADTAPAASEPAPTAEPAPSETPPADQAPADATPAPADSGSATPPADAPKQ
jgi:hypothetical protein